MRACTWLLSTMRSFTTGTPSRGSTVWEPSERGSTQASTGLPSSIMAQRPHMRPRQEKSKASGSSFSWMYTRACSRVMYSSSWGTS